MAKKKKPTRDDIKLAADRAEGKATPSAKEFKVTKGEDDVYPDRASVVWPEKKGNDKPIKGSMMNVRYAIDFMKDEVQLDTFRNKRYLDGKEMNDTSVRAWRKHCFK